MSNKLNQLAPKPTSNPTPTPKASDRSVRPTHTHNNLQRLSRVPLRHFTPERFFRHHHPGDGIREQTDTRHHRRNQPHQADQGHIEIEVFGKPGTDSRNLAIAREAAPDACVLPRSRFACRNKRNGWRHPESPCHNSCSTWLLHFQCGPISSVGRTLLSDAFDFELQEQNLRRHTKTQPQNQLQRRRTSLP